MHKQWLEVTQCRTWGKKEVYTFIDVMVILKYDKISTVTYILIAADTK